MEDWKEELKKFDRIRKEYEKRAPMLVEQIKAEIEMESGVERDNIPCPWCGKQPGIHRFEDGTVVAVCSNADCPIEGFRVRTEEQALRWWNNRYTHY